MRNASNIILKAYFFLVYNLLKIINFGKPHVIFINFCNYEIYLKECAM